MNRIDEYYVGKAKGSIGEFVETWPLFFKGFSLLITCLDSSPNIRTLCRWLGKLDARRIPHTLVGNSVLIEADDVQRFLSTGDTFWGFDELYLVVEPPQTLVVLDGPFTSERANFDTDPQLIVNNLRLVKATRYLADGCGINYACESADVATQIEAYKTDNEEGN